MKKREKTVATDIVTVPELIARDERGTIEKLVSGDHTTTLRITSKKGTVRANHYHQKDSHTCYLSKGKIEYVTRTPAASAAAPMERIIIEPGQLFYTPPLVAHAMVFLEDSEFYCFSPRSGDQAEYEHDIIRTILVSPEEATARAQSYA